MSPAHGRRHGRNQKPETLPRGFPPMHLNPAVAHPDPSTLSAEAFPSNPTDTPPLESSTDGSPSWIADIIMEHDPEDPALMMLLAIGVLAKRPTKELKKLATQVIEGQFTSVEHMASRFKKRQIETLKDAPEYGRIRGIVEARKRWDEAEISVCRLMKKTRKIDIDDEEAVRKAVRDSRIVLKERFAVIQNLREAIASDGVGNDELHTKKALGWLLALMRKNAFTQQAVNHWGGIADQVIAGELTAGQVAVLIPQDLRANVGCLMEAERHQKRNRPTMPQRPRSAWSTRI